MDLPAPQPHPGLELDQLRARGARHRWQEAVSFALRAHRHQLRRDQKTPYAAHVIRVAMIVTHVFGCTDEATLCAAILHDTIEDTTTDYDDLAERFGTEVADLVAALTKNMALPEPAREAQYDAQLARAVWKVKLVKLADTYDNLCDVATHEIPAKKVDALDKCRRAVAIAQADGSGEPTLARAIQAVQRLMTES